MEFEPLKPGPEADIELRAFLASDQSRLGEVFRATSQGLKPDEIASQLGVATSNFVWNVQQQVWAILEGKLPSAPSVQLQVARKLRALMKAQEFSLQTTAHLQALLLRLDSLAEDPGALLQEERLAKELTERVEAQNRPGIYVYSLPHYIRYPYDQGSGRTLMKVGRSDKAVMTRIRSQVRATALPEDPVLLRVYSSNTASLTQVEQQFHRLLVSADHLRAEGRATGREWFLTKLVFLDEIAKVLNLEAILVSSIGDEME